jgi:hypothetical protein
MISSPVGLPNFRKRNENKNASKNNRPKILICLPPPQNVILHVSKIPMLLQMSNSVLVLFAAICLRSELALYSLISFPTKKKTLAVL